jgi:streptogramin lyase
VTLFPVSKSPSPYVLYPSNDSVWIGAVSTGPSNLSSQILQFFLNGTVKNRVPSLPNVFVSSIVFDSFNGRAWFPVNNTLDYYDPHTGLGNATTFSGESPQYIAVDPVNGNLWLSLVGPQGRSSIAMFNPSGPQQEPVIYPIRTPNATVQGITVAPNGAVWFTEAGKPGIGELPCSSCNIVEYAPLTLKLLAPIQVAVDQKGVVWFTDHGDNEFGWFNPQTEEWSTLPIGYCNSCAYGLPNAIFIYQGEIWISEHIAGRIGRYNPNSSLLTEYTIPSSSSPLSWWAEPGPNNLIWFTALGLGEIGYVNASLPVPISLTSVLSDTVVQRGGYQRVSVIVNSSGQDSFSLNSSVTTQDASGFYPPQIYSSSQSDIAHTNGPYSTSMVVFAAWNAAIGTRNVALTVFNGQLSVSRFVRVSVIDSSAPYVALGFASVIVLGSFVLYMRRPHGPRLKPIRRIRR